MSWVQRNEQNGQKMLLLMVPTCWRGEDTQNTSSRSDGNKLSEENQSREESGWGVLGMREATIIKSCQGRSHRKGDI